MILATMGLVLLAGAGFTALWAAVEDGARGMIWRAGLATAFAAGLVLVIAYVTPVYLQTTAEVVRENRVGSLPLAWRPPGGLPATAQARRKLRNCTHVTWARCLAN